MADDLVIANIDGDTEGNQTWFHGINGLSGYPANPVGIAFLGYGVARMADAWQYIDFAGLRGVDVKWFGRSPVVYNLKGVIASFAASRTQRYTDAETNIDKILELTRGGFRFSLTGPINKTPVVFPPPSIDPIGANTGPVWFFSMPAILITGG